LDGLVLSNCEIGLQRDKLGAHVLSQHFTNPGLQVEIVGHNIKLDAHDPSGHLIYLGGHYVREPII